MSANLTIHHYAILDIPINTLEKSEKCTILND